jgi:hypothetical protein
MITETDPGARRTGAGSQVTRAEARGFDSLWELACQASPRGSFLRGGRLLIWGMIVSSPAAGGLIWARFVRWRG